MQTAPKDVQDRCNAAMEIIKQDMAEMEKTNKLCANERTSVYLALLAHSLVAQIQSETPDRPVHPVLLRDAVKQTFDAFIVSVALESAVRSADVVKKQASTKETK